MYNTRLCNVYAQCMQGLIANSAPSVLHFSAFLYDNYVLLLVFGKGHHVYMTLSFTCNSRKQPQQLSLLCLAT